MKRLMTIVLAGMFAACGATAFAASHTGAKMDDALAKACKDQKPGTEVTVDGKKTKCPEAMKPAPAK